MNESINDLAQKILGRSFWENLEPSLSICTQNSDSRFTLNKIERERQRKKLLKEGYAHLKSPGSTIKTEPIIKVFETLDALGLPPVFAFVYDEPWLLNTQLKNFLSDVLDDSYYLLPDFWAWLVKPGESGWSPHRDKPRGGSPEPDIINSVTVWIPLTEANPQNGCIYVLPADRDPMYKVDNPQPGFPGQLADIRALPASPGDILVWTQQILHWGSHASDDHHMQPRMNVAFEYQRGDIAAYNQPLLEPGSLLCFEHRIALISRMIMQYRRMYDFTEDLLQIAHKMHDTYKLPGRLMRDLLMQG